MVNRKGRASNAVIPTVYGTHFSDLCTVPGNVVELLM
jgi:hypothetical protein